MKNPKIKGGWLNLEKERERKKPKKKKKIGKKRLLNIGDATLG